MNNKKRMIAVIAASGLALGSMTGVANAQGSAGLDLGLNLGANGSLGDLGVDLGVALGSTAPEPGADPGSLTEATGSLTSGSEGEGDEPGSLETALGSLTGPTSSLASLTGSASGENSSLSTLTGSATEGSSNLGSGDIDLGSVIEGSSDFGSGSGFVGPLLALGSLAAIGVGVGMASSGGSNIPGLPPLPEINVGLVCNLPQEAIDFLKDNGSMKQEECEPEEQN